MAFGEFHYFNPALRKMEAVSIILPELNQGSGPFAVMYLLHGLSDDNSVWSRRTSIERYVQGLPLMVVMPNGGRSFYVDAPGGPAYDTAIARDLIRFIDTRFNTIADRKGRVVCGLSMGGYGALHLALGHPDLFCAAVSHSGALQYGHENLEDRQPQSPEEEAWITECVRILGPSPRGGPNDLYALAERVPLEKRPALRIDCGHDDYLLQANRDFHAHLTAIGYPHEYEEFPGAHTWEYWDRHVQDAIAFFARQLGFSKG